MATVPMTSTSHALGISLLLIMLMTRAGHDTEELFHGRPTLDGRGVELSLVHPVVDGNTKLRHLHQGVSRDIGRLDIGLDVGQLGLHSGVIVGHGIDPAEEFERSRVSTLMPAFSSSFSL